MDTDLQLALRHHQRGLLAEATRVYLSILAVRPRHAEALHLLGVVALQQGNPARGIDLIGRASALNPAVPAYHANLGEGHRLLGQFDRAAACCRTALRLQPDFPAAANSLGLALLARGQAEAGIAQLREAVRLQPEFAMFYNNLGNALRAQGDKAEAVTHFRQAVTLDPTLAEVHSNLGQLLLELKEVEEAVHHCREAVRLRPNFAEAHSNLGNVLRHQGKLDEARACYVEALRLNPNLAMAANNIGQALQEEAKLDEAIAWYQRALQQEPDSARIHTNLASALAAQENYEQAAARYQLALDSDPTYAEAHHGLGWVRQEQGLFEQARACYQESVRLQPDLTAAHGSLGTLLEELGDFDAAQRSFREALRHEPDHAGAHTRLAVMLRDKLPQGDETTMRRVLAGAEADNGTRSCLHFGLAQVHDARREFDSAAEHLEKANVLALEGLQKHGKAYDPVDHAQFIDALLTTCTPEFFEQVRGIGLQTERPVFIVGLPRSGTTLAEQILASHSRIFGGGELPFVPQTFLELAVRQGNTASPVECLGRIDRSAAHALAEGHLERLGQLNDTAARVVDKLPDNCLHLGLLATLFPRAKFIYCRRDLRDIAVSCWMTSFRSIRWANDLEHIASRLEQHQRLMAHWRRVLPVPVLELEYEETVRDIEGVARRLVAWCGLSWEPACLAFHETRRPVRTASLAQVRQPVYSRSVARWKHYERALAPLFARLQGLAAVPAVA